MKSIKIVFIKAACMLAFILVSNSFSLTPLKAQVKPTVSVDTNGDIRYISAEGNALVFELNLKNLPTNGSNLQITDEAGNLIFEERIPTATLNVRYKIERNNIHKLTFEVSGRKLHLNKSFSINSRLEEKIEVAKL